MSILRFVIHSTCVYWRLMASREVWPPDGPGGESGPPWTGCLQSQRSGLSSAADLLSQVVTWASISSVTHGSGWTNLSMLKLNQEVSQQGGYWTLRAAGNKPLFLYLLLFRKEKQWFLEKQLQACSSHRRREEVASLSWGCTWLLLSSCKGSQFRFSEYIGRLE